MNEPAHGRAPTARRRVALRALIILRTLINGPASAGELIAAAENDLGPEAFGSRPVFALRRDPQALRAAGFAVRYVPSRRHYALATHECVSQLSTEHARALGMLLRSVHDDLPFGPALRECLAAMVTLLPEDFRQRAAQPGLRLELRAEPPLAEHEETLATLERALATRRCVRFTYRSASRGEADQRTVEPLDLVFRDRHAYLEALDTSAGHDRQFRVDRMADVAILPRVAPRRPATRPRLRLRFWASPRLPRHGPDGFARVQLQPLPDGRAIVAAETTSLFWAARTLLAYGEYVEALHPPGLRRELRRLASAIAARYEDRVQRLAESSEYYGVP